LYLLELGGNDFAQTLIACVTDYVIYLFALTTVQSAMTTKAAIGAEDNAHFWPVFS
jgi:hypothetical protein